MEERKRDKINKTIRRTVKGSPLLIIVLLAVTAFVVGATLINLWTSQIIPDVYQVTTDFRGVDAQLMQAGNWARYTLKSDATSLADQMHGLSDGITFASNAAILVIHAYDLPTEDLTMTISVFEKGSSTTLYGGWTCTATFVEFCRTAEDGGGDGKIVSDDTFILSGLEPSLIILNAEIEDMVYVVNSGLPKGDCNALILSFEFTGDSIITKYAEKNTWISTMDFTTIMDLTVTLTTGG